MTATAKRIASGVYRIGTYVAFREDFPSTGEWDETPHEVTWGVVDAERYNAMDGDVGLPDSLAEFTTLKAARRWIAAQDVTR